MPVRLRWRIKILITEAKRVESRKNDSVYTVRETLLILCSDIEVTAQKILSLKEMLRQLFCRLGYGRARMECNEGCLAHRIVRLLRALFYYWPEAFAQASKLERE